MEIREDRNMNEQNNNTQYNYNNKNKNYQPTGNYNSQNTNANRQTTYGQQATSSQQYFQAADMTGNNNGSNPTYKPAGNMGNTIVGDDRLISPQEKVVATLGQGALTSFAAGDGWANQDAILTDKHLYYIHSNGILMREKHREIVNINDITGTKIVDYNPLAYLIIGAFFVALTIFEMIDRYVKALNDMGVIVSGSSFSFFLGIYLGIPFLIIYFIFKKKFLSIEYPGGSIKFKLRRYKMEQVIEFQKAVHRVKMYK